MNQRHITKGVLVTTERKPEGWVCFVCVSLHNKAKQTLTFPDWPLDGGLPSEAAAITNSLCAARRFCQGGAFGQAIGEALNVWRSPRASQMELPLE